MIRHLSLQSGKCLTRARFTVLLFGQDPTTTIVGTLNFLCSLRGSIRLKPPNVTPASRIGQFEKEKASNNFSARSVPSIPSTPIHPALTAVMCGPSSLTATRGAFEPPSLLGIKG